MLTVIDGPLVRELLPMAECIDVMAEAMAAASAGSVRIPPRSLEPLPDDSGYLLLMPGASSELGSYGAKLISLHPGNAGTALPVIQGFVSLFDYATGAPVAIVEGSELTALRTGAASGLATRLLAREDASSCGIFGTGVQAQSHLDAMAAVRDLREIVVWGRDASKARHFAAAQSERTGLAIRATDDPAEAAACDVLCTVTASPQPVLRGDWVNPGAHINLAGAHSLTTREADSALMARSRIYVDLLESCRNEGGDVMIPVAEGVIGDDQIVGEIGQLAAGTIAGRSHSTQVTVYNSLGITAQDLFAARRIFDKALAANRGSRVVL